MKRVFLIVLDSLGIGNAPDARIYGDEGSNTLRSVAENPNFDCPIMRSLGLFNIDGVGEGVEKPLGAYARLIEKSAGKDTTTGHWEIAGLTLDTPFPTYPNGFPEEIIKEIEKRTGRAVICNKPYSGTEVIKDYGEEHLKSGALIVYTSADSVLQIAAHEERVSVDELYRYCEIVRKIMTGKHAVGRIIARPFSGEYPFYRTPYRHDYSLVPPRKTMLDKIQESGLKTIGVGKINDIFAGQGVSESYPTKDNAEGMEIVTSLIDKKWSGLCFVNLVDFDSKYGHRNDADGYAIALTEFDKTLEKFISLMEEDDILILTADHGCDPKTPATDHTRECVPLIIFGKKVKSVNLGTLKGFDNISSIVLDALGVKE